MTPPVSGAAPGLICSGGWRVLALKAGKDVVREWVWEGCGACRAMRSASEVVEGGEAGKEVLKGRLPGELEKESRC